MPINYKDYPADWKERRARVLDRDNHSCATCGARNGSLGYHNADGSWTETHTNEERIARNLKTCKGGGITRIVLTVAHLKRTTGDDSIDGPIDCPDEDLSALCQRHHLALDKGRHTRKAKVTRQRKTGQEAMPL
jgi:hypothetical protein